MALKPDSSRALAVGLFIVGVLFMAINIIAMQVSDYWFPKIMIIGIVLTCLGTMMMIFPPADFQVSEPASFFKETYKRTRKLNIVMWALSLVISVFIVIWYIDYMHLSIL